MATQLYIVGYRNLLSGSINWYYKAVINITKAVVS